MAEPYKSGVIGNGFEITDRTLTIFTGFWPMKKRVVIPLRNIASAEKPRLLDQVVVRTNDGKKFTLSTMHPQEAIDALLGSSQ
jgi:hypothetical protein